MSSEKSERRIGAGVDAEWTRDLRFSEDAVWSQNGRRVAGMFVCWCVCVFVRLFVCLIVCLFVCLCVFVCVCVCLFVCMCCLFVCLSVLGWFWVTSLARTRHLTAGHCETRE